MSPRLLAHVVAAPAVVAPLAACGGDDGTTTVTATTTGSRRGRSRVTETSAPAGVEPRSFRAHFEGLTTIHREAEGGHGWTQF
jgi:hypothetical protein